MNRSYYDALFADYDIVQRIKWRSTLSSLLIGLSFFLNLILPASWIRHHSSSCQLVRKILYPANRLFIGAAKKMKNGNFLTAFAKDGFVKLPTRKKQSYLKLIDDCFAQSLTLADVTRNKSTKLEKKWTHATGHVKHVVNPHREYNNFRRLILDEHICSAIKKFFPNKCVYMTHSKISFKAAGLSQEWLPHQDSAYKLRGASGLTVAILLERCHVGNGAIQVYPRTQFWVF